MPGFDGNGNFSFTYNWVNDANNGIPITASRMDTQFNDAALGFDDCITRDGQSTTTAIIPFSTGLTTDLLSPYTALGPVSLSAGQLKFPGTQNASANVNTLDDYEEGTFSPALTYLGTPGSISYLYSIGAYTKIGNRVLISINIALSAQSGIAGAATITGLPFTSETTANNSVGGSMYITGVTSAVVFPMWYINPNTTAILLQFLNAGTAAAMTANETTSGLNIILQAQYQTAS